jgi:hypothetical protein
VDARNLSTPNAVARPNLTAELRRSIFLGANQRLRSESTKYGKVCTQCRTEVTVSAAHDLIGLPRFARTQQARLGGAHQRLIIDSWSLTAGYWRFRDGSAHPEHGNEERGGTDDVELDKKCWNPIEILKVTKSALGNDDAHQDA